MNRNFPGSATTMESATLKTEGAVQLGRFMASPRSIVMPAQAGWSGRSPSAR
jgi:hypothetical protein